MRVYVAVFYEISIMYQTCHAANTSNSTPCCVLTGTAVGVHKAHFPNAFLAVALMLCG